MSINQILKGVVFCCLFLTLLIPFVVSGNMYFPYIVGKALLFRTLIEIGFLAWIILALRDVDFRPKRSWILWTLGIFLIVIFFADIFGIDPGASFWSNFERMEGFVTLAHLGVYFLMITSAFQKKIHWDIFWHSMLAVSLIVCLQGFIEATDLARQGTDLIRVQTTFGNTIYVAAFLVINIFIALIYLVRTKSGWATLGYSSLILLQLIGLYLTSTRGAILGLGAGILIAAILGTIFEKENKNVRKASFGVILLAVVAVGAFFLLKDSEIAKNNPSIGRLTTISFNSGTGFSRKVIWTSVAPEGFKERPILGWGQNNFTAVFDKYYDPRIYGHEQWFDRTHNIIFDWLIAGGILGLLSYLALYVVSIINLSKSKTVPSSEKFLLIGLLTAYFIQNIFVFDSLTNYLLFFSVLGFIHKETASEKPIFSQKLSTAPVSAIALISLILVVVAFEFSVRRGFVANTSLFQGKLLFEELADGEVVAYHGDVRKNIEYFDKALNSKSVYGTTEIRQEFLGTAERMSRIQNIDEEIKKEAIFKSEIEMEKEVAQDLHTARSRYILSLHYGRYRDFPKAKVLMEQAANISPRKQSILEPYSALLAELGEADKAVEVAKYSFELEPTNVNGFNFYIVLLRKLGKTQLADAEIERIGLPVRQ